MKITNIKKVKIKIQPLSELTAFPGSCTWGRWRRVSWRKVVAFLEVGEQYQVDKLKEIAENTMVKNLKKENMIQFFQAADMFR